MPVFPEVASSRIESGASRPLASRSSTRARATRSFTEPVGVAASSLAKRRTAGLGERRAISTTAVPPIDSTSPSNRPRRARSGAAISAPCDRRQKPDLVALLDRRREALQVADVAAVEVDVDEPVELALSGEQLAREGRVPPDERLHGVADRRALDLDRPLAVGLLAEHLGQPHDAHRAGPPTDPPTEPPNEPPSA